MKSWLIYFAILLLSPLAHASSGGGLIGNWVNGYGDQLSITEYAGVLSLEIPGHCYSALIISDGLANIEVVRIEPEVFCAPTPKGQNGSLDAVRSALSHAQSYNLVDGRLTFFNEEGRVLAVFDRLAA